MRQADFQCDCGWTVTTVWPREGDSVPLCLQCDQPMMRLPHYSSLSFKVPLNFHTTFEEVLGSKDDVKEQVRKGEIIPVGKGSRWV